MNSDILIIKQDLKLSDRQYTCDCGLQIDRDLNASINIRNYFLIKNKSLEYSDYRRGEIVRPAVRKLNFILSTGKFLRSVDNSNSLDVQFV